MARARKVREPTPPAYLIMVSLINVANNVRSEVIPFSPYNYRRSVCVVTIDIILSFEWGARTYK